MTQGETLRGFPSQLLAAATFPVTDPKNQDAMAIRKLAGEAIAAWNHRTDPIHDELQRELAEAVARIGTLKADWFESIAAGEQNYSAMLLREEESGVSSIVAQMMQDQDALDIAMICNAHARPTDLTAELADTKARLAESVGLIARLITGVVADEASCLSAARAFLAKQDTSHD